MGRRAGFGERFGDRLLGIGFERRRQLVHPRDPFVPGGLVSLGKSGLVEGLFQRAGFRNTVTTRMEAPFRLATTAEYLTFVRASAGPILQILAPLGEAAQQAAWVDIAAQLEVYQTTEGWIGPNTLLLTRGQR